MQDQLRQRQGAVGGPVQANPGTWAGHGRDVRFGAVAGGELFRDGATVGDVVQGRNGPGYFGDCWLLASLAALAHTRPGVLEQAVTDHGDGTYTVRLFAEAGATGEDVRVTGALPQTTDGRDAYAQRPDPAELWVGIIEKAFASWKGGYGNLHGGLPSDALTALTGERSTTAFKDDPELGARMQAASAEGAPMVAASAAHLSLSQGGIVPGHAHTVLDVRQDGDRTLIKLRDTYAAYEPSGNGPKDGVFELTLDEFRRRFQYVSWGQGSARDASELFAPGGGPGGGRGRDSLPWER